MTAKVLVGDCREVLLTLEPNSIDACVTDPPYGLEFMGKEWDRLVDPQYQKFGEMSSGNILHDTPAFGIRHRNHDEKNVGRLTEERRAMQAWHETWAREVYRVLKPGAHLLAFSGTRTSHRMVCAIEDAGFEIRDCLMWLYGSGFPKSLDVSKAMDKAAGYWRGQAGEIESTNGAMSGPNYERTEKGEAITDLARQWDGWGTALKPAYEPIVLARKPLASTVAANVTQYGTGALNIDGCRIETSADDARAMDRCNSPKSGRLVGDGNKFGAAGESRFHAHAENILDTTQGRWPANLIFDEDAARLLDELSGERPSRRGPSGEIQSNARADADVFYGQIDRRDRVTHGYPGDTGGASRFFYTSKSSRAERNKGLAGMPELATQEYGSIRSNRGNGYEAESKHGNHHPTVKPVDLMQWLVRLITPKGGIVLDPFMGSGSTGIAADREGFDFIGIEQDAEYAEIARKRIVGDCPLFTTLAAD